MIHLIIYSTNIIPHLVKSIKSFFIFWRRTFKIFILHTCNNIRFFFKKLHMPILCIIHFWFIIKNRKIKIIWYKFTYIIIINKYLFLILSKTIWINYIISIINHLNWFNICFWLKKNITIIINNNWRFTHINHFIKNLHPIKNRIIRLFKYISQIIKRLAKIIFNLRKNIFLKYRLRIHLFKYNFSIKIFKKIT